jgi:hypothetical protein
MNTNTILNYEDFKKYYEKCYCINKKDKNKDEIHYIDRVYDYGKNGRIYYQGFTLKGLPVETDSLQEELDFSFPRTGYRNTEDLPFCLYILRVPKRDRKKGIQPSNLVVSCLGNDLINHYNKSHGGNYNYIPTVTDLGNKVIELLFFPEYPDIITAVQELKENIRIITAITARQAILRNYANNTYYYLYDNISIGTFNANTLRINLYPEYIIYKPLFNNVLPKGITYE